MQMAAQPAGGAGAPGSESVPTMPTVLQDLMSELEAWALLNKEDARKDTFKFWALKVPAIVVSASSGVFVYLKWEMVTILAGAVASLCVLLDGIIRGGMLRNVHLRAFHDLRNLEHDIQAQWRVGSLQREDAKERNELAASIIASAEEQRKEIAAYLKAAETAMPEGGSK